MRTRVLALPLPLPLLLLLVPALAAAKYDGVREEREPVSIAIIFSSQHPDRYLSEAHAAEPLVLHELLRTALDAVHAAGAGRLHDRVAFDADVAMPVAGSQAIVIGYDAGARVIATVPLDELRGDSLGPAHTYRGRFGNDLAVGLELALAELAKSPNRRRALIVIGDGGDANLAAARAQLASFAARADAFGIRIYGLRWRASTSGDAHLFPLLTRDWEAADPLATKLPALIARIARAQPAIERAPARPSPARPLPWFWFGVAAIALAIGAAVVLSRPRAMA